MLIVPTMQLNPALNKRAMYSHVLSGILVQMLIKMSGAILVLSPVVMVFKLEVFIALIVLLQIKPMVLLLVMTLYATVLVLNQRLNELVLLVLRVLLITGM